jgi:hypothetical protein
MGRILALIVLACGSVSIAESDDKPAGRPWFNLNVTVVRNESPAENDARLAKRTDALPQKIGVLSYYANKGGGYTFMERGRLAFYALPYKPCTSKTQQIVVVQDKDDKDTFYRFQKEKAVSTVGTSTMPFGGLTVYRCEMFDGIDGLRREDIPIAKWTRDTPTGEFRLSIVDVDSRTRVKVKSIKPVLERAEHAR